MPEQFDFDKALEGLRSGQDLMGKDGLLTPLIKQLTEVALAAELESHLKAEDAPNNPSLVRLSVLPHRPSP